MLFLRQLNKNLFKFYRRKMLSTNVAPNLVKEPGAAKRIVWVDLEMTGLNIDEDKIMEIACVVTDADLNIIATGPDLVIHQPDTILQNMHQWCIEQHGESGLTEKCRRSTISVTDAEYQILQFIKNYVPEKKCPMAGNSIYMDRLFIRKYMPLFNDYLHYRNIDVSTIKELAKRWHQKEFAKMPIKTFKHRAINDILESINELKYYKQSIFK